MKPTLTLILTLLVICLVGCTDQKAAEQKAKEDAEAKVRAEAARKEMETLPTVFQNRDYFKKNTPDSGTAAPNQKPKAKTQ